MGDTSVSKAPRCTNHSPMSAVLHCDACKANLCRLCVTMQRGTDVCADCKGPLRRLSAEELGQAAHHQTTTLRQSSNPSTPTRAGSIPNAAVPKAPPPPVPPAPAPPKTSGGIGDPPPGFKPEEKAVGAPQILERKPPYFCKNHEKVKATRGCSHCSEYYCNGCAKMIEGNPRCPDCGGQINALLPDVQRLPPRTLGQDIHDALLFPFKGSGVVHLILGSIFIFLLHFAGFRGRAIAFGYMYVYGMKICKSSATGRETPSEWPAFGDLGGGWYFFIAWLVSRIPAIITLIVICAASPLVLMGNTDDSGMSSVQKQQEEDDNSEPIPGLDNQDESMKDKAARKQREKDARAALRKRVEAAKPNLMPYYLVSLLGDIYMPMALLALILFRSYSVLNPLFIFGSIQRVGSAYLATFITITAVHMIAAVPEVLAQTLVGTIIGKAIVPFVGAVSFLYLLTVSMRALGMMYYYNQKKLEWFT